MADLDTTFTIVHGRSIGDGYTDGDLLVVISHLQDENDQLRDTLDSALHDYSPCRCGREAACPECLTALGECGCSSVEDDLADELIYSDGEVDALDPLTRTLLGLPSGIHCHTNGCRDA